MGCSPVLGDGTGVAGGRIGIADVGELVLAGAGELVPAAGDDTVGGLAAEPGGVVVGSTAVDAPNLTVPDPQQKLGGRTGVGVLVSAGGVTWGRVVVDVGAAVAAEVVEPTTEPAPDPPEPAPADALPTGAGWFGGTDTGPGPKGATGRGVQVGEGVGVGKGVGVGVTATWAMTSPDGTVPAGRTTGLASVELAGSTATTSAALVEVVPSR
jgi:hypothetical protein